MFSASDVQDNETTYRIPATRSAEVKARALAAYFAPDEVHWRVSQVKSGKAVATPVLAPTAIANRLDWVLGPDAWQERYDDAQTGATRCTLQITFDPLAPTWIERVGCSFSPGLVGHDEAFARAAERYGVGRYLAALEHRRDYDEQAGKFKDPPALPTGCLPIAFRPCGPERARELTGLIESACEKSKLKDRAREAALIFLADLGYSDVKQLPFMETRHVLAGIKRAHEWIQAIANDASATTNAPVSPFYRDRKYTQPPAPTPTVQSPPPPPAPAKTQAPAVAEGRHLPTSGAELLGRLKAKDMELTKEGRILANALVAHVIEEGAKVQLSADICQWQGTALEKALTWGKQYIDAAPPAGTYTPNPVNDGMEW